MASNKTYVISTQTLTGSLDSTALKSQIAGHDSITIAIDRIDTALDLATIYFKDELPDAQWTLVDALVAAHDGNPLDAPPQIVQLQPSAKSGKSILVHGEGFEAELNQLTTFDIVLAEDREVQGAAPLVWNPNASDWLSLEIVHPQLGVIAEMARQVYVPSDGKMYPVSSGQTKELVAGLILRLKYCSTATAGPKPYCAVNFIYYRDNAV